MRGAESLRRIFERVCSRYDAVDVDASARHRVDRGRIEVLVYLHSCLNLLLMTIEAAQRLKKDCIYQAAMLDPHTAAELSIDDIVSMCDELIEAHGSWLPKFH